jgi:AP-1-like transcription factor
VTENEILKATTGNSRPSAATLASMRGFSGTATEHASGDTSNVENVGASGSDENMENSMGKKSRESAVLTSGALWDYIVEHPLIKLGHIDLTDVCDRLRRLAKPGKNGPVFPEEEVRRAIEGSRRGGGDALL